MATLFQTSRPTIREAMSALELAGLVEVMPGRGVFVTKPEVTTFASGVLSDLDASVSPSDLLELRRALEPATGAAAALRREPEQLAELEAALEACAVAWRTDTVAFEEADDRFHLVIAYASHNPLFIRLAEEMSEMRSSKIWQLMKSRSALDPRRLEVYVEEHRAILEAIRRQDPEEAAAATTAHLEGVHNNLLEEEGSQP
jgi:GntR family transcriptional repressor for pyruvate dehydrogenase complex